MGLLDTNANPGGLNSTGNKYYSSNLHTAHLGKYQFTSLTDVVNQFLLTYVGRDKVIDKVPRSNVVFFAKRALAELSFDTLKSCKSQEIVLPPSLQMTLPHDYVNYVKLTWSDSAGIEHIIYPTSKTSNPNTIQQNEDGEYLFTKNHSSGGDTAHLAQSHGYSYSWSTTDSVTVIAREQGSGNNNISANFSGTWVVESFGEGFVKTATEPSNRRAEASDESWIKVGMEVRHTYLPPGTTVSTITHIDSVAVGEPSYIEFTLSNATTNGSGVYNVGLEFIDNTSDTTWGKYKASTPSENNNDDYEDDTYWPLTGQRYGLDPQHAQTNGSFFIDCASGKIHFSSNLSGKTIILKYISDSLGVDAEMVVPKLAEEAIYKWIVYSVLSAKANVPEHIIQRFKKEKFAETRKAKIRLSNIKLEEITQILRGKSKWIKH